MLKKFLVLLMLCSCIAAWAQVVFEVEKNPNGSFVVKHRGTVLLQDIAALVAANGDKLPLKEDYKVLPDGTRVWNIWSEEYESKYRMEVVLSGDTQRVEISLLGEAPAWAKYPDRKIKMVMPLEQLKNAQFKGVVGLSRGNHIFKEGVFNDKLAKGLLHGAKWRFLAINGGENKKVIMDFDPIGPTNPCPHYPVGCIFGMAMLDNQGDRLDITCGSSTREEGGMTGTKIVLNEGSADDFNKIHVLPHYHYNQHVTPIFYDSFGAEKTGKMFKHLDLGKFSSTEKRGWIKGENLRKVVGSDGAFYSHVAGEDGILKYNLPGKGLYIFTFHMGNSNKSRNKFDLSINGREYLDDFSVPAGKIAQVNIPVWITGDSAEIEFDGDFILSTLSIQYFISDKEDYSFFRGFWFTEGFESANAYHSKDYQRPLKLDAAVKIINMPVPGRETARLAKELSRKVDKVDMRSDKMKWSFTAKMKTVNGVRGTLNEYHDPARMQRLISEAKANGINVFMFSGMHGRHGFPGRLQQQAEDIKIFTEAAHKANIKVIDHHDSTFMENWEQGLRVMAERSGEMAVSIYDFAPTPHFCLSNKDFTETYRKYLKNVLEVSKVDGFQIDELSYYRHGCLCFSCREYFERDTNWQLPMNELDMRLYNRKSDLWKMWFTWRKVNMANWWIGLRNYVKDVAPDMFLSTYCTHREQLQSLPSINLPFDLLEQARGIAWFGSEVMPRNPYFTAHSLFVYRKLFNMFCIGYNTPPIWAWYYTGNWNVYYFCWAVSNMFQQSAMVDGLEGSCPEGVSDFLTFNGSSENPDISSPIHAAQAAILYHPDSRDYNTGISYEPDFGGFAQTFHGCNVPYDIIEPRALHNAKTLNKYKVLFVVSASCLNDSDIRVIKKFAADGGTVVLTTVSGLNDHWGNRRGTWAFRDVFNVHPYPHFYKLSGVNLPGRPVIKLDSKKYPYYAYYRLQGKFIGEVILEGVDAENNSKVPLIIRKKYGKGEFYHCLTSITAAFFTGEFQPNQQYRYEYDRDMESFMQSVFAKIAEPARIWKVQAPRLVLGELYYQKSGGYIAHFLNASGTELEKGETVPNGTKEEAWPALKEDVVFTLRDGKVSSAYAVSPDFKGRKTLKVEKVGGQSRITLPKEFMRAYSIVYIK